MAVVRVNGIARQTSFASEVRVTWNRIALTAADFYKTMPAEKRPGLWQDVYRPMHCGIVLYVKLQLAPRSDGRSLSVVVQFKRK